MFFLPPDLLKFCFLWVWVLYPSSSFHAQVRGLVSGSPSELLQHSTDLRCPWSTTLCLAYSLHRGYSVLAASLLPDWPPGGAGFDIFCVQDPPRGLRSPSSCFLAPSLNSRSLSSRMSRARAVPSSGGWNARQFRVVVRSLLAWAGLGVRKRARAGGGR